MASQTANPARSMRLPRGNNPKWYAKWIEPNFGWTVYLCKSYQADNSVPYARWHLCIVTEQGPGYGDEYVKGHLRDLQHVPSLEWDTNIWATREDFLKWAKGTK